MLAITDANFHTGYFIKKYIHHIKKNCIYKNKKEEEIITWG